MTRDSDLEYHEPGTRAVVIRVRDIFDDCKDSNPRWLPGLLLEEMYTHGLITEKQHDRWREDLGL